MNSFLKTAAPRLLLRRQQRPAFQLSPFKMSYIAAGAAAPGGGAQATVQQGNKLKALFDADRPALGGWQMIPGPTISRLLAQSGVDWVLVDCEHGGLDGAYHYSLLTTLYRWKIGLMRGLTLMFDIKWLADRAMHEAVPAIAALGVSPVVRIPGMEPWMVKRECAPFIYITKPS